MYEGLTKKEIEIAKKFESMTEEDWEKYDKEAEKNGLVVKGPISLDEAIKVLDSRKKKMISMRIEPEVLKKFKAKAERVGIPYQTLAASVLKRYAESDLDIIPA